MKFTDYTFYLLLLLLIAVSCKKNSPWGDYVTNDGKVQLINYDLKSQTGCAYILADSGIIQSKVCIDNAKAAGTIIKYYNSGIPSSVQEILDGEDNYNITYYHENGIVFKTMSLRSGKAEGVLKIFYPSGYLKAVNLVEHDSIFYIRTYADSLSSNFAENIIPILTFDKDSASLGDTINYVIRLPLNGWNGIESSLFEFHHDDIPVKDLHLGYFIPRYSDMFNQDFISGSITSQDTGKFQFFGYIVKTGSPIKYQLVKKGFTFY